MAQPKLSVCMTVRNEEHHLAEALASCGSICASVASEIVVVDTGSQDGTLDIARAHPNVRLFEHPFVNFADAKQHALDRAQGDWVFVLDADERVSAELALEIEARLSGPQDASYRVRRRNWMLGREMRTMGFENDSPLRLFPRQLARFDDRLVHEGIEVDGPAPELIDAPLDHYTFGGIDAYLRKVDLYTTLEIQQGDRHHDMWHLVFTMPSTFWRFYVGRGGWRDGFPGYLWASLTAIGKFVRDVKLWVAHEAGPQALREPHRRTSGRDDSDRPT